MSEEERRKSLIIIESWILKLPGRGASNFIAKGDARLSA